ncbi:MAG: amidohydrolase family protein, partial [Desulfobacterales bacterium]
RLAEEAMEHGAFGISSGLIYPPGSWSTTEELVDVVSVVAARGGRYFSHIRNESDMLLESINEALEIGRLSGAHTQISHFKAAGRECWNKSTQALETISRAAENQPVGTDMYPYTSGSTTLVTLLPPWALQGSQTDVLARLGDQKLRNKMAADMATGSLAKGNWENVLIIHSKSKPEYVGHRIPELAFQSNKDPDEWLFDALIESHCDPMMVLFMASEDNRRREIAHPLVAIGTDGFGLASRGPTAKIMTHPRSFGTFPRVLGHYCREEELITLEEAVHKMTGLAAHYIGLNDRGEIRERLAADITIFNPQTVIDTATYECPKSYPIGIDYVLVGGQLVVNKNKHTGARPGRVLRRN